MAFTQSNIDALDAAYASGAQSVSFSDGSNAYWRSVDEYFKLRAFMVDSISESTGTPAIRCTLASYSRD